MLFLLVKMESSSGKMKCGWLVAIGHGVWGLGGKGIGWEAVAGQWASSSKGSLCCGSANLVSAQ